MNDKDITIRLSASEALVLFEWLARLEELESAPVEHEAEQKVLWVLEGLLEKSLSAQFAPNYRDLVEEARRIVDQSH